MAGTHAALAVRGNSIYLFYATDKNPSGTLSAISSQPPSSSSSSISNTASPIATSPVIPASASSFSEQNYAQDNTDRQILAAEPAITPTTPNNGGGNSLYMQPQAISPDTVAPGVGGQVTSISIASTSSYVPSTNTYRHDLLLAYNFRTQPSILARLTPMSPGTGSGLQSSSPPASPQWSFDLNPSQSLAPPLGVSYLWLAAGTSGGIPADDEHEGTTVYQLVAAGPTVVPQLRIIDVTDSGRPILASPAMGIQRDLSDPVVVRLKNNVQVDTAVIGVSVSSPLTTAIRVNSDLRLQSLLMPVPEPFDGTACYTDGNGQLVKATQQFIQSMSIVFTGGSGSWTDRKNPTSSNNLPSPILACASIDNTLFAVLEGPTGPVIYTADMSAPTGWVWRQRQLININNGNTSGNGGALFWFLWRRRRASGDFKSRGLGGSEGVEKITVRPPLAPPPQPGAGLLHQQHTYSPVFSENSATAVMVPGQVRYMSSQSLGQQPVVSMSPQMNYHQPIASTAAPGWTTAVYPTGGSNSQPGEYIPMVASSLSTAPPPPISTAMYGAAAVAAPVTASSIPSTPGYSHAASPVIFGDKQELT
ncbi:hypothetical protein BGZ95_002807, partial [Linnemannia exigua]